jgi:ATP-dependent DNA helicase PIF1
VGVAYVPLRLAWAVTIHKSQGMTLDAIEIDIGSNIFTVGQAYTALSRARNLKSVRVVDVAARSFCASRDVLEFFNLTS